MTEDADNRSKWRKTHVTDVSLGEYCILKDTFLVPFKEAHVTYDYSKSTVKSDVTSGCGTGLYCRD